MTEFDNTNRGVLFKNKNKTEDYHGDMSGSINIDGVEYFLDAWAKESKAGERFLSLKRGNQKKVQASKPRADEPPPPPPFDDDLDSLPF